MPTKLFKQPPQCLLITLAFPSSSEDQVVGADNRKVGMEFCTEVSKNFTADFSMIGIFSEHQKIYLDPVS